MPSTVYPSITEITFATYASSVVPSVSPFRALRYDETTAGPLTDLVAPPYDVIDDEAPRATSRAARTTSSI